MRAPLSWIREFTPVTAEPGDVARALDTLGLEVEAVDEPGREVGGVVVARALAVRPHPDADRLSLVDVDLGGATTRVVCGAPNVVAGMLVPYAPAGATLPGGVTLSRRKIRGVVSDGMLCSPRELGLGEDHAGILRLDEGAELGADVREVLGLDDAVFELAITPNRPDAMSVVGVARELAAHFRLPFTVPEPALTPGSAPTADFLTVEVEAPERAPRFTARHVEVVMGPSPAWMARRLRRAGMRPISNVVDATNYVLLERGQPLHAFDAARLAGGGLVVRLARAGERITTLDGVVRALDPSDLLVCDAERAPQAIAGIMGGAGSDVLPSTAAVAIEAACFEPLGISRTSKRLGLRSESSARFERGVDPDAVLTGSARAAELLAAIASGRVAAEPIDRYPSPVARERIRVRTSRVGTLLGIPVDAAQVRAALDPLGIETAVAADAADAGDAVLEVLAPTFRPDLTREIDIVEEVGRRVGLDSIPRTLPHTTAQGGGLTPRQRDRRSVADALVGQGAAEAMTLPLVPIGDAALAGAAGRVVEPVAVANPLRADESTLRSLLLPGLLRAAAHNAANGLPDVALFELGQVFLAPSAETSPLPVEEEHLAVVVAGTRRRRPVEEDRPVDAHDAVDAWWAVAGALELADARLAAAEGGWVAFPPERSASIVVDGRAAGWVTLLGSELLVPFGLAGPVAALEVDLGRLWGASRRDRSFRPPSRFPVSAIDLAFVVGEDVLAGDVVRTLKDAAGELAEDVRCFDEFRRPDGKGGARSLAFALRLRAPDRTLTDAEVAELRGRCIAAVGRAHGGRLRG